MKQYRAIIVDALSALFADARLVVIYLQFARIACKSIMSQCYASREEIH